MTNTDPIFSVEEWENVSAHVTKTMQAYVAPFTTPIALHHGDWGELWGTGSYLLLGDRPFILTNMHVAKVLNNPQPLAHKFFAKDDYLAVRGDYAVHPLPFDTALLPVHTPLWAEPGHGSKAITTDMIALAHTPVENELLTFVGFAGEHGRFAFNTLVSTRTGSTAREVSLSAGDDSVSSRFHFGIDYRPGLARNVIGQIGLPIPKGFSGSAVWNTRFVECALKGEEWSPDKAQVTGLVWGWPSSLACTVALRSEYIRSFLLAATDQVRLGQL